MIGCCCEDCVIGQDLFDGDLSNWTTTGTVAIDDPNDRLEMTGASTAYFDFVPASGDDWVGIRTTAICAAATGELLIVIGRIDDNNYIYGRLVMSAGVGTISIGYFVGGVDTPLGQEIIVDDAGADLEEPHDLQLCIRPGDTQSPSAGSAHDTGAPAGHSWARRPALAITVPVPFSISASAGTPIRSASFTTSCRIVGSSSAEGVPCSTSET